MHMTRFDYLAIPAALGALLGIGYAVFYELGAYWAIGLYFIGATSGLLLGALRNFLVIPSINKLFTLGKTNCGCE